MVAIVRCGPFDLIEPIGQGSTGTVWRARHRAQGIEVAVKILGAKRARVASAFRNEVRAAARLDHPNVVMLFEQGHVSAEDADASRGRLDAGCPYLGMELCTGGSMAERKYKASWPRLQRQLSEILGALAHAHSRGVIHRDLKPGNALLQGEGESAQVKLSDFGIAHALIESEADVEARNERLSGTLQYMAPEQLSGQWRDEGPWTDLYALGVIAYEAVGGRLPWRASNRKELVTALLQEAPPVRPRMPVPDELQSWLDRLLAKRPVERFSSAATALSALHVLSPPVVWQAGQNKSQSASRARGSAMSSQMPREVPARPLLLQGLGLGLYGLRPARLAGRSEEKVAAWSELGTVVETGRCRVMLLRGPMGVGTSKLAEWLSESAHAYLGASTMLATHSPIPGPGDGLPAMLSRYWQCLGLTPDRQQRRCVRLVEDYPLPDDAPRDARALARLLTGQGEDLALKEQQRVLTRSLQRLARVQPLVVVIDNAQWASHGLRLCKQLLDEERPGMPVLFALLVDDEALSAGSAEHRQITLFEEDSRVLTLRLGDISPDAHRRLIEDLLGLDHELMDRVCDATHGDALFASALLRDWVRTGALEATDRGFALRTKGAYTLPSSLDELWDQQLRRLAEELEDTDESALRQSLEIAAALGESVEDNEWRLACTHAKLAVHDDLVQALTELNMARRTHLGWRFKHSLMRRHIEALADRSGRKGAQHLACAAALVAMSHDSDAMQSRIGQHYVEAGAAEESVHPLLRAAIYARERSDWNESHRLFELLEASLQAKVAMADERRIEASIERVPCYVSQGQIELALQLADAALEQAQAGQWAELEARTRMAKASIAFAQSDLQEAMGQLRTALVLLGQSKPLLQVSAHTRLGSLCMWSRELEEASEHFAAAQAIIGDDPVYDGERGRTLRGMSNVAHCRGDYEGATTLMLEARACFEREGNRFATAGCINDLGELKRHQGAWQEAEALYRQSLELFESVEAADASTATCNLGYLLVERKRYGEARTLFEELLASDLTRERQIDRMWISCGLWACAAAQGRWQEWDTLEASLGPLAASALIDEDLADVTKHAADLARRAGQYRRAKCAYLIALAQYQGLGDSAKAAEIRQLVADLG